MRSSEGHRAKLILATLSLLAPLSACNSSGKLAPRSDDFSPGGPAVVAPLGEVDCDIDVFDVGIVNIEDEYLPSVITCENGGANLEALKAQAIAARSVAYYAIATDGGICDSQACQVYSCAASPGPMAYAAVEQTRGQYLSYNQILTYGFYVAGDNDTQAPSCVGTATTGTETWVTYNEGLTGTAVEQTALGFVHDPSDNGYGQNRGCMSQWGARCLENSLGYAHDDILRFYYGADIELLQASGACLGDGDGDGDGDGEATSDATGGESVATTSLDAEGDADAGTTTGPSEGDADTQDASGEAASSEDEGVGVGTGGESSSGPSTNDGGTSGCGCDSSREDGEGHVPLAAAMILLLGWRRRQRRPLA